MPGENTAKFSDGAAPRIERILVKIETIGELPTLPEVVKKIREVAEDRKASAADLANVILEDASLTSRVLRLVNSSYYMQFSGKVSTVTRAIVILGFGALRDLALGLRIQGVLSRIGSREQLSRFWTLSLAGAVCSKDLAVFCRYASTEEAFIAGLLQNLGQLILQQCFPEEYKEVLKLSPQLGIATAEREVLKIDHAGMGKFLAQYWHFPPSLVNAIGGHHQRPSKHKAGTAPVLADLVQLGGALACYAFPEMADEKALLRHELNGLARLLLGRTPGELDKILSDLPERVRDLAARLDINIAPRAGQPVEAPPVAAAAALQEQLRRRDNQLAMLQEVATAMVKDNDLQSILQLIAECIYRSTDLERIIVFLSDAEYQRFQPLTAFGVGRLASLTGLTVDINPSNAVFVRSIEDGAIQLLNRHACGGLLPRNMQVFLNPNHFLLAPLHVKGLTRGFVYADNGQSSQSFDAETPPAVELFLNQARLCLALHSNL